MSSIRLRLLKYLIGPILLINLAGGALIYMLAWVPATITFDQGLVDAAGALAARVRFDRQVPQVDLPRQAEQVLRTNAFDNTYFVVRDAHGTLIAGDADFPLLHAAVEGTASMPKDAFMRGEPVRLVALAARAGGQTVHVGVARTLRKRQQIRAATVRALILLEATFSAVLVLLIWYSVSNGLLPLDRLRAELNARDERDLAPLDPERAPYELGPVLGALNGLLGRVQAGAKGQQDFLANVAHQLRTPLAGLQMQLEWLGQRHPGDADTARSVALMLASTERMIRQTNQLLALARAEPSHFEHTRLEPLDLRLLVERSIQTYVEQAARKRIDIGFDLTSTPVLGDSFLLRDLIDNLIDNALRYTPSDGTVTVRCRPEGQTGMFIVEDSGPGIPLGRREQVFSRFVRLDESTSGSGLGLAIVRDIALAHKAIVTLSDAAHGGAMFSVRFPAG